MPTSPNFFCGPGGVPDPLNRIVLDLFAPVTHPEVEGWYWFRWSRDGHDWMCVEVERDHRGHLWALESRRPGDENDLENMIDGEWRGPIPMPPK